MITLRDLALLATVIFIGGGIELVHRTYPLGWVIVLIYVIMAIRKRTKDANYVAPWRRWWR